MTILSYLYDLEIHILLLLASHSNSCLGSYLIDLEKAFDTVWKKGLILKLIQKHFTTHIIHLTQDMIPDIRFDLTVEETTSDYTFPLLISFICLTLNPFFLSHWGIIIIGKTEVSAFTEDITICTVHQAVQGRLQRMHNKKLTYCTT